MKLAIIGTGAMGSALVKGFVTSGIAAPAEILLFDKNALLAESLATSTGCIATGSAAEAAGMAEYIIIAVKPAVVQTALAEISGSLSKNACIISIAAGVKLEKLQSWLPDGTAVIRVMPNTPCMVGKGASGIAAGSFASQAHVETTVKLLESVGIAEVVDEKLLDGVTGLSGSGPAYIYMVIEALADGGVREGLTRTAALRLAAQTVSGAAQMVIDSGQHPAVLRDQVTSPGGTTIAAVAELEKAGLRSALINAVKAASNRSKELNS